MSLSSSIEFEGSVYRNGHENNIGNSVNGFVADDDLDGNALSSLPPISPNSKRNSIGRRRSSGGAGDGAENGGSSSVTTSSYVSSSMHRSLQIGQGDDDESRNVADISHLTDRYGFITKEEEDFHSQPIPTPVSVIRNREKKWIEMLNNWPSFMNKNFDKVKDRCRKGIPPSIRPRAWKYLCGAQYYMTNPQTSQIFEKLEENPGHSKWREDIQKDIFRQFPNHELFSRDGNYGKNGQEDLLRLLNAWTIMQPDEGYCQGQAPIAATLLMQMPVKDAFYCFVQICQKYLPGYYSPGLEAIQLDGDILFCLLRKHSYSTYKHLKKQSVDPVLYMVEWFMCAFCRTLPWATVLRVWDIFFCEGVKVLFKVAIVLMKYGLSSREQLKKCPSMYETVERLKRLPPQIMQEEFLVRKMAELNISDEELERVHYKQTKLRAAKRQMTESSTFH